MKIRDAQEMYRAQIRDYNSEMSAVSKRRKEIQNALKNASGADKDTLDKEAATIELTYKALQDKQNEYYDYVNDLTEQWCMWANAESAKQQGEAMKDYYRDMAKVMEVARRLMKGDIVPSTDEKKLMEYTTSCIRWLRIWVRWLKWKKERSISHCGTMRKKSSTKIPTRLELMQQHKERHHK